MPVWEVHPSKDSMSTAALLTGNNLVHKAITKNQDIGS
jgi:hypothetical protein